MTQGRGIYNIEPSHYAVVPAHTAAEIIESSKKEHKEEE